MVIKNPICLLFQLLCLIAPSIWACTAPVDLKSQTLALTEALDDYVGTGKETDSLAAAFAACPEQSLPLLRELAQSAVSLHQKKLAALMGFVARDFPRFAPEDFSWLRALFEAINTNEHSLNGGWVVPALATLDTPEGDRFLLDKLFVVDDLQNQFGVAIERMGARAIPRLLAEYNCFQHCEATRLNRVQEAFGQLKAYAETAAPPLAAIAVNKNNPELARASAIYSLAALGETAGKVAPQILPMVTTAKGELRAALTQAFIAFKNPAAGKLLAEKFDIDSPYVEFDVQDFALIGPAAYDLGPKLLASLQSKNWDLRYNAAKTLGAIGYLPAKPGLIKALDNQQDWRLVLSSLMALSQLDAREAKPQIETLAHNYWWPPVQLKAQQLLAFWQGKSPNPFALDYSRSKFDFDDIYKSIPGCSVPKNLAIETQGRKLYERDDPEKVASFRYRARPEIAICLKGKDGPCEQEWEEHGVDLLIRYEQGWFGGLDRGEFGGGLVYFPDQGEPQVINRFNIEDIYQAPLGLIAIAEKGTLSGDNAFIGRIVKDRNSHWQLEPLVQLPVSASQSALLDNGDIFISGYLGSFIFSRDGQLRTANCTD